MRILLACLSLILLCSCASYKPVSNDRVVLDLPSEYSSKNSVKVTMKRDSAFAGGAITGHFYLDDEFVVTLKQGNTFTFYTTPGRHILGSNTSKMTGSFTDTSVVNNTVVNLDANRHYIYMMEVRGFGQGGLNVREETNETLK